jgi:hypothetical protein
VCLTGEDSLDALGRAGAIDGHVSCALDAVEGVLEELRVLDSCPHDIADSFTRSAARVCMRVCMREQR